MTFQEIIMNLLNFWQEQGCCIVMPYDIEVGAGTFNPATFFRVLGRNPWKVVYVEPSRRPADARYAKNPNRLYQHHQLQVIIKPSLDNIQDIYLESLQHLKINIKEHDIRFIEDDWESESLGAVGVGWEVRLDGLEITQFTYFQQMGGIELYPISVEITYGLERIAMYLQRKTEVFDIVWNEGILYRDLQYNFEVEFSKYSFEVADKNFYTQLFKEYKTQAEKLLKTNLCLPAYDYTLKCSHVFNILDARRVLSYQERQSYIQQIRELAHRCASLYLHLQKTE